MGKIALLDMDGLDRRCTADAECARRLPAFYMNDHSVLALAVRPFDRAVEILRENDIPTATRERGAELLFSRSDGLARAVGLLRAGGVACETTDAVRRVYQG